MSVDPSTTARAEAQAQGKAPGQDPGRADVVLFEDRDGVRIVTLNRPERRNAIDLPLRIALAEILEDADRDPAVRAIVLHGAGEAFCSGGDVSTMQRSTAEAARPRAVAAQRVIRAIWGTPKPVIAAVEGAAYGAGASLAMACDRVVAAEGATFSMSFTGVGLAGDMGIFASLPARVGRARARQLLMLPAPIHIEEAAALGMVDRVVERGQALGAALEDGARLAAGPPLALGVIKEMLGVDAAVLDREIEHQIRLFSSDDFAEGVAAFAEKRRPVFRGVTGRA